MIATDLVLFLDGSNKIDCMVAALLLLWTWSFVVSVLLLLTLSLITNHHTSSKQAGE